MVGSTLGITAPTLPRDCTFAETEWRVLAAYWHPVAFSEDVGSAPIGARLLDEDLVVYRTSQGVVVAKDICLHRGSRLTLGRLQGDELICAYHGWRYGPEGRCTRIPAQPPERRISPSARLLTFPSVERYGLVWTCLAGKAAAPLPEWSEPEDPAYRWVNLPPLEWKSSAARQIDNFLDVSHFPFVHVETFGNAAEPLIPDIDVQKTEHGLHYTYDFRANNPEISLVEGDDTIESEMVYDVTLPFAARLRQKFPEKGEAYHVIFNVASPVSAKRVRAFFFVCRNFDHDIPAEEIQTWEHKVMGEDQRIVESQRPEELPLDLAAELHVRSDNMTIAYRKELARLGLGNEFTA